jgi:hypothetical protein
MTGRRPDHIDCLKICGDDVNICRRLSVPSFFSTLLAYFCIPVFLLGGVLYLVSFAMGRAVVRPGFYKFFLCDINIHLVAVMVFSNGQRIWLRSCKKATTYVL